MLYNSALLDDCDPVHFFCLLQRECLGRLNSAIQFIHYFSHLGFLVLSTNDIWGLPHIPSSTSPKGNTNGFLVSFTSCYKGFRFVFEESLLGKRKQLNYSLFSSSRNKCIYLEKGAISFAIHSSLFTLDKLH